LGVAVILNETKVNCENITFLIVEKGNDQQKVAERKLPVKGMIDGALSGFDEVLLRTFSLQHDILGNG